MKQRKSLSSYHQWQTAGATQNSNHLFCYIPALLAIVAASLFALQTDDRENSFQISRGEAFYIQVIIITHLNINISLHNIQIHTVVILWGFE
jgi:hypothetical protein